jgi:hypothetical protein
VADPGYQTADHQTGREENDQRCEIERIGHRYRKLWRDEEITEAQHGDDRYECRRDEAPLQRQQQDNEQVTQQGHRNVQPQPVAHHGDQ